MSKKKGTNKGSTGQSRGEKQKWNETELKLATGALTLAAAFILSQLTGISHEVFYGSFQRYVSGFLVLMFLYLMIYIVLYKRFRA